MLQAIICNPDGSKRVVVDGVESDVEGADLSEMELAEVEAAAYVAPVVQVPQSVTALQALLAIDEAGISAAYLAWATSPDRTFADRAFIDKAQTWRRDDPTLLAAATSLGLSPQDVDGLFILGETK